MMQDMGNAAASSWVESADPSVLVDDHVNGDCETDAVPLHVPVDESEEQRQGTISSARYNILSTMVGGGSLSLPMAFHKSGNAFIGPLFVIAVAGSAEFCFHILIASATIASKTPNDATKKGHGSFESVASAAFGPKALVFSMGLVTSMCFFGTVGYAVLLRDMLVPITDAIAPPPQGTTGVTLAHNVGMLSVVLAVTPLCTLKTFTALRRFGAASMASVLILGACVVYRSVQCNFSAEHDSDRHGSWLDYLTAFPRSRKELLDAFPLFISCFVCHYNILPVHNELRNPTPQRVSWWVRSTTWFAASFYLMIGFSGSMYGNCTPGGAVQGNILLDFDEDDPLLLMGRMCLALTITLAFPMLVIPARDILIRIVKASSSGLETTAEEEAGTIYSDAQSELREPLMVEENGGGDVVPEDADASVPLSWRIAAAIVVIWSGAAVACCVTSIAVVWDLLGSSLAILLSYLIPCGSYIVLTRKQQSGESPVNGGWKSMFMIYMSWFLVLLTAPLMFISTGNAVRNTFFKRQF
jgi:amino acid permease